HLVASRNEIRFLIPGSISNVVLVYNYVFVRLSCYYASNASFCGDLAPRCAAVLGQTWCAGFAPTYGTAYVAQENSASPPPPWLDVSSTGDTNFVSTFIQTAWVKTSGLQGYQRLRHTMGYAAMLDPCDMRVTINYDYGASSQSASFTYAKLSSANSVAAQWDVHTQAISGKAMSVQVQWSDAAPTGGTATTGQGVRF